MKPSKVYIIGAGPGQADLITVRGLNILKQADVVVYDYLLGTQFLDKAPIQAEQICTKDLGKFRYNISQDTAQASICDILIRNAKQGKRVVRLKNGDPMMFSRIEEELSALTANKIEFEIVPGISAGNTAGAFLGIPLTAKAVSSSAVFVTGHNPTDNTQINWNNIAQSETIVLYMAIKNLPILVKQLQQAGKPLDTPVALISHIGKADMKMISATLDTIVHKVFYMHISPPAICIIGSVVSFEKKYNWLRDSKKILFTGLSDNRYFLTGTYFHLPMIKILPLDDYTALDSAIVNIRHYDWLVFASRYGVKYFFERLSIAGYDTRNLAHAQIGAVGKSTGRCLQQYGIKPDLIPTVESSIGLLDAFSSINLTGKKLFMPRSDISDKGLADGFAEQGALVTSCYAYKNVPADNLPDIDISFFDEILFTSPSTVRSFIQRYKTIPKQVSIKYIGDATRKEARKWGLGD